jgi:glycosyltransferase involved in cell wall biosynthesis
VRVLLAAKHAPHGRRPIGGVQSWCATVCAELARRGHEAVTWGPELALPVGRFDAGIIANAGDTGVALEKCDRVLAVCHGIIPAEQPPGGVPVAYTSEGVRAHWGGDGPVVRQPIDLDFWTPGQGGRFLTRFSYRRGLDFLPRLAERMGLRFRHVSNLSAVNAREVLQSSACVLATGRAALEAMACGVPVVICDHRIAYQGPLLDPDTLGAMARNYSGRGGVTPTPANVAEAVQHAMGVGSLRHHVEAHHDVRKVVGEILALLGP